MEPLVFFQPQSDDIGQYHHCLMICHFMLSACVTIIIIIIIIIITTITITTITILLLLFRMPRYCCQLTSSHGCRSRLQIRQLKNSDALYRYRHDRFRSVFQSEGDPFIPHAGPISLSDVLYLSSPPSLPQVVLGFESASDAESTIAALRLLQQQHLDHMLSCRQDSKLPILPARF
jgi:hypothetical protein